MADFAAAVSGGGGGTPAAPAQGVVDAQPQGSTGAGSGGKTSATDKVDTAPPGIKPQAPAAPAGKAPAPKADPAMPAPKAEPAKPSGWPREVEFKINGEKLRETFDSEEHFINEMQRRTAEAQHWRKKQNEIQRFQKAIEEAKGDPLKILKAVNPEFDPDKFAIEHATKLMELDQMDPRERELMEHKQKLEEYQRKEQERAQAEENAQLEQTRAAHRQRMEKTLLSAIEELGGGVDKEYAAAVLLPDVAGVMLQAQSLNPTGDPAYDLTPKEIAAAVHKQHTKTSQRVLERMPDGDFARVVVPRLAKMDGNALVSALGPDAVAKIVSAHMNATAPRTASVTPAAPVVPEKAQDTVWNDDARREQMGVVRGRRPPRL